MSDPRFNRLTQRQKDCLRGVAQLRTSKQIALDLGISESTVNGHLDAAARTLDVRGRTEAALLFQQFERDGHPPKPPGQFPRVETVPALPAGMAMPPATRSLRLPIRTKGADRNDLSPLERLAWIAALAIAFAIGFGMLGAGLTFAGNIIHALRHL